MKTLTTRKFFHSPGMVKSLRPGTSVVVTDKGKPAFVVTKAGERPIKTVEGLRREARKSFRTPGPR
jgi:antitoxin (DNA-binding transcriptional repressor) of toxin-antitoxin stability system